MRRICACFCLAREEGEMGLGNSFVAEEERGGRGRKGRGLEKGFWK